MLTETELGELTRDRHPRRPRYIVHPSRRDHAEIDLAQAGALLVDVADGLCRAFETMARGAHDVVDIVRTGHRMS